MRALAAGLDVWIALLTAGGASHTASRRYPPHRLRRLRLREFLTASARLRQGAAALAGPSGRPGRLSTVFLGFDDAAVPHDAARQEAAVARLLDLAIAADARTLWCSWSGDPHRDHVAAAALGARVRRRAAGGGRSLALHHYAVWGRFGPLPARALPPVVTFADPEAGAVKVSAMECYASQLTALVADDPDGFVMPSDLVRHFAEHPEIFIAEPGG